MELTLDAKYATTIFLSHLSKYQISVFLLKTFIATSEAILKQVKEVHPILNESHFKCNFHIPKDQYENDTLQ